MIRVLHVVNSLGAGGIETWLKRMLRQVDRQQVAMDVCCKGRDDPRGVEYAEACGARVFHIPLGISQVGFITKLGRLLGASGYDLVHNHLDVTGAAATWAARRAQVPVISSFHNTSFPPHRRSMRWPLVRQLRAIYGRHSLHYLLDHAARITGCSQAVLDAVCRHPADRRKAQVLYYGVDVSGRGSPQTCQEVRREFGWSPQTPVVLHVGRFAEQKNHVGILQIFGRVRHAIPEARLLLVGRGPLRETVERQAFRAGLADAVVLAGVRQDVPRLMGAADVFLFPSLHEGFGLVTIEACASGLPVVGSDIPGHDETVVHGRSGFLFPVTDEAGMAAQVVQLLTCRDLASRVSHAALQHASDVFSLAAAAQRLVQLYRDVLGRRVASHGVAECPAA